MCQNGQAILTAFYTDCRNLIGISSLLSWDTFLLCPSTKQVTTSAAHLPHAASCLQPSGTRRCQVGF